MTPERYFQIRDILKEKTEKAQERERMVSGSDADAGTVILVVKRIQTLSQLDETQLNLLSKDVGISTKELDEYRTLLKQA